MKISFVAYVLAFVLMAGCDFKLTPKRPTLDLPPPASSEKVNELVELNRRVQELQQGGKYAEAIPPAQRAAELYEKDLGPDHPFVATALTTLAELYRANGEHARAEPPFTRVLAIREAMLGPGHPDVATALNDLALLYDAMGDYAKSQPLYQRALAIRDKAQGGGHPDVATALNNLALLYDATGNAAKAEPLYQRALSIREQALGREHPLVAAVLNNLAVLLGATGSPAKAESMHQQALAIREKAFGPGHPDVAASLNNLADLYRAGGSLAKAEPLYRRALAIREKALGAGHPDVATTLNNLAELYRVSGNGAQAGPLYQRALAIREKALGPDHLKTALTLTGMGALHDAGGDYAKAELLYRRALVIRGKGKGVDSPDVAATLGALALIYKKIGDYEQAESLYRRVIRIQEKALGPAHRNLAAHLSNLAAVHEAAGNYTKAEPLYQRVLDIHEKVLGPEHPTVAADLSNLGVLYAAMGNAGKAEAFYRRALDIREKVLGTGHPSVATELNNLAALYRETGDRVQAEALLRQALEIDELALGPNHPNVATDLSNLAALYHDAGNDAKAKPLLRRALAIDEGALGPAHLTTASSLSNLARLYQAMGENASAVPLFRRALAIQEQMLGVDHPETVGALGSLVAAYTAEGEFAKAERLARRVVLIREQVAGPDHPAVAQSLITFAGLAASQQRHQEAAALFTRGLALQEKQIGNSFPVAEDAHKPALTRSLSGDMFMFLSLIHQHVKGDRDAAREGLELVLRRKGAAIDAEFLAGNEMRDRLPAQARREWQELHAARGELARLVRQKPARMSADTYREALAALNQRIDTVEQRLAGESALAARALQRKTVTAAGAAKALPENSALVEFVKIREFDFGAGKWKASGRYLAFVLRKSGEVAMVDLGDAAKLEERARRVLEDVRSLTRVKPVVAKPAKKLKDRSTLPRGLRPLEDLYAHLWAPLEQALGSADKILLSPDGLLNLVPFAALQDSQGRFLVERYQLAYFAGGGELTGGDGAAPQSGSELLLVANPAFGKSSAGFAPLSGTEREGQEVAALIGANGSVAQVLVGKLATESAVKAAGSPRILHLATRGFFLSDEIIDWDSTAPVVSPKRGRSVKKRAAATPYENPLGRSGLALAGANQAAEVAEGNDGLLTAQEISGLDLAGTELVVLPVCETGAGKVQNGDGVFGLRRAFALAGAKNLLMSLWLSGDEVAARQVKDFYRKVPTLAPAEALRQAQLESIRELKATHGNAPPGLWAPFILQGAHALGR
ncbi:MAG: tetratricopeptide repeat protein [Nitrospirales bacterium]|nr:tetratricopeptide repeat protein [Nitrospirales bacterium]